MSATHISWLFAAALLAKPVLAQQPVPPAPAVTPSAPHPAGSFVSVHGVRFWYESEGSGEPLVLIAGGPGYGHEYFHPWFTALAAKHRIIYFDALGRGKSEHAKDVQEYTLTRDVDDLEELRKALGLGTIDVLGHSYGGIVAQAFAIRYPKSVRHLILADTAFDAAALQSYNENLNREVRNQYPEVWEKMEALRAKGATTCSKEYEAVPDVPLPLMYFYNGENAKKLDDSPMSMEVACAIAGPSFDVRFSSDLGRIDFRRELKQLTMPTLILAGRYDRVLYPSISLQYKTLAPQARFVMFEKSGHFPFIEETDQFMQTVEDFLDRP